MQDSEWVVTGTFWNSQELARAGRARMSGRQRHSRPHLILGLCSGQGGSHCGALSRAGTVRSSYSGKRTRGQWVDQEIAEASQSVTRWAGHQKNGEVP